jgi:FHS family L-fucose permease-like MFS transporter
LSDLRPALKHGLTVAMPLAAFVTIWLLTDLQYALHYGVLLSVLLVAFFVGEASAHRMLAVFGALIIALLATGMFGMGEVAKWAVLGVGLFCSVMWSNIFSLAIEGLGPLKSQASSLLVMAILGGALLPPLQGAIADWIGLKASLIVPMVAFAYVVFYGIYGWRAGRKIVSA